MKFLLFAVVMTLLASGALLAGSVSDLDREAGFRDAKLGSSVESFSGLVEVRKTGVYVTYKRPADDLHWNDIVVTNIQYRFMEGKLVAVDVELDGDKNRKAIFSVLQSRYGQPTHINGDPLYTADGTPIEENLQKAQRQPLRQAYWIGKKARVYYLEDLQSAYAIVTFISDGAKEWKDNPN